jgi:LmbE family N-acetylglucosaminyl deacetylase
MLTDKRICVIVAHPDDEILGLGGTLARLTRQGCEVHTLILAEGITSRYKSRNDPRVKMELDDLRCHAEAANRCLGVERLTMRSLPDNRMDSIDLLDLVKVVEQFIVETQPEVVFTHWRYDVNIDHQRISDAVVTALRPMPGNQIGALFFMETLSSTEWTPHASQAFWPNAFCDISDTLAVKIEALSHYQGEMRPPPHARSLENIMALARFRGCSIGVDAAEAFVCGRLLDFF